MNFLIYVTRDGKLFLIAGLTNDNNICYILSWGRLYYYQLIIIIYNHNQSINNYLL